MHNFFHGIRTITPEENFPLVRVGISVRVRVSFMVGGRRATRSFPPRKTVPWLGLGIGLGLVLGLQGEGFFLGANCPRTLFHIHGFFYTHINIYHCSSIDMNYIFFHPIYIYIHMIYALLMFLIHLFL